MLHLGLRRTGLHTLGCLKAPKSLLNTAKLSGPVMGVRHKSEIATEIGKVSETVTDAVANAAPAVSPDQIGYFQSVGLAEGWIWPQHLFQHAFEYVHVYTGLPWWATIVSLAVTTRALMLPLYLSSSDAAAKMARVKPELNVIMERTKNASDQKQIQEAMIDRRRLMKDNNIKVLNMAKPLLGVPVFLGFFNALRGMSSVPVDGLTTEGALWFTNLAIADPYCGLQIITATLYAATFKFFGGETGAAQVTPVMKKVFTYMPFIAVPLTMSLPASICLYFAVNSVWSIVQSNVLKWPWLRKTLKLAPMVTPQEQAEINKRAGIVQSEGADNDSIVAALRKKYQDAKDQAERRVAEEERKKRADALAKIQNESEYIQFRGPTKK